MKRLPYIFFLFFPLFLQAQTGLRVYTVAGNNITGMGGDGGPATAAGMAGTEGIWVDGSCNLYLNDGGSSIIRKIDLNTGIITTAAGVMYGGFSGDGGPAMSAKLRPYGLYTDLIGNIYIADAGNKRIRRVDAGTNIISTFAGGGSLTSDGIAATSAKLTDPAYVYGDGLGNIFIGDRGRIRKVNSSGIITTVAGTGVIGFSGDGGPATNAQIYVPAGMLTDASGNLLFADRGNARIHKINKTTGIITTIAGTTDGYSGDGGPAINAQLSGPISFAIDKHGNLIIGDNGNNYIRKVDAATGIITTIAGVGTSVFGDTLDGVPATTAEIHPEFLYLDLQGNLYYSNFGGQIRKIVGLEPGLMSAGSTCGPPAAVPVSDMQAAGISIYPNPVCDELVISVPGHGEVWYAVSDAVGRCVAGPLLCNGSCTVAARQWQSGVYFVTVTGPWGRQVSKIIKY